MEYPRRTTEEIKSLIKETDPAVFSDFGLRTTPEPDDETPQTCDICGDESSDPVVECGQCSWNMGECCMYDDICKDCAAENGEREEDEDD